MSMLQATVLASPYLEQDDVKVYPVGGYGFAEEGFHSRAYILSDIVVPKPTRYRTCSSAACMLPRRLLLCLSTEDVPAIVDTFNKSLVNDPLEHYFIDTPVTIRLNFCWAKSDLP